METGSMFGDRMNLIIPRNECFYLVRQKEKNKMTQVHTKLNRKQKREIRGRKRKIGKEKRMKFYFSHPFLLFPSKAQCQSCKLLPQNTYRMHFNVIVPYSGWPREEHDTIKKKNT